MTVAILCIGTELSRGEVVNTNGAWLAAELTEIGLEVADIDLVDDDRARIVEALERLASKHEVVLSTGGLGPTTDDLTTECAAQALEESLIEDPASLDAIAKRLARFGRTMTPTNAKQAKFPRSAEIIPNAEGTAPGFAISLKQAKIYFMPGVPREMKAMFTTQIKPKLARNIRETPVQIRLRTFGMGESGINDALAGIESEHDVTIGYRVKFPEVDVKIQARGASTEAAMTRARAATDVVVSRLGEEAIFTEGDDSLPEVLGKLLTQHHLTLAVAESCTGGLIAHHLTSVPGSSAYFRGAVVAYHNEVKTKLLGVSEELLARWGAVSEPVARSMAEGTRRALGADVAIATTGIAGPTGGSPEKPLGTVFIAVATPTETLVDHRVFPGDRERVQLLATYHGMNRLRQWLRTSR